MTAEQKVAILQRFTDRYADDLRSVLAAFGETPPAAQRLLIGALNYGLDNLDMFPDHFKGLGVADDAIVIRLAAKLAAAAGATHASVVALANEAVEVEKVFDDLVARLEQFVAKLPDREVRGRTADKILSHKDTRIMFEADVGREAKRHTAHPLGTNVGSAERVLVELRKMAEHGLEKAGIAT
jgi:uncharacterized membrane protein YkvA (DUF1232 family)